MRVLKLSLKKQFYDMIERANNPKREEYRELKDFLYRRLMNMDGTFQHYDYVTFSYGYTKRTMTFKCDGIRIGYGNPEWGGSTKIKTFIISIGKLVSKRDKEGNLTIY